MAAELTSYTQTWLLAQPSRGLLLEARPFDSAPHPNRLKDRLMAAVEYFNNDPVVHTWTYKLDKAA
jgi:hypothetical protein